MAQVSKGWVLRIGTLGLDLATYLTMETELELWDSATFRTATLCMITWSVRPSDKHLIQVGGIFMESCRIIVTAMVGGRWGFQTSQGLS